MSNAASWPSSSRSRISGASRRSTPLPRSGLGLRPSTPPSAADLEVRFLSEVVAAHAEIRTRIEAAFFATGSRKPDLVGLRSELLRRLDLLHDALRAFSNERDAVDALVPFVFFVDEQVEHALASATEPGAYRWPQLQRDLFLEGRAEGGDVFFELGEQLLAEPAPRTTVIAVYLFCLKAEFRGRLADGPEGAVERWIDDLAAKLPLPSGGHRVAPSQPAWHAPRPAATYVVVALVAIVAWHLVVAGWASLR